MARLDTEPLRMPEHQKTPVIENPITQVLIRKIINDTIQEKDRSVTIRIEKDGTTSISIYPVIN